MKAKKYIGFDLDGTLAHHAPGDSTDTVGPPIAANVARARAYLDAGEEIRIITARAWSGYEDAPHQISMIEAWCEVWLGRIVPVQAHKCGRMHALFDDRAVAVERNTGVILGGNVP